MSIPSLKMPVEYNKTSKKILLLGLKGIGKIPHFHGTSLIESMFFLYIFKKYKTPCYLIEDYTSGYEILGITLPIENEYDEDTLRPIVEYLKSIASKLVKCILNGTNIIMIPLELKIYNNTDESMEHANMLIYRKKYNHIEHFEPHGQKFMAGSIENRVLIQQSINLLLKIFVESINEELLDHSHQSAKDIIPIQLITSNEVCPYLRGFQAEEEFIELFKDEEKEGAGYCSAWSMFFTELCLKNPDLTSNEIITRVFRLYDSATIGQFLRNVIRGYALFIDEKINKYYAFLNDGKKLKLTHFGGYTYKNGLTTGESYFAPKSSSNRHVSIKLAECYNNFESNVSSEEQKDILRFISFFKFGGDFIQGIWQYILAYPTKFRDTVKSYDDFWKKVDLNGLKVHIAVDTLSSIISSLFGGVVVTGNKQFGKLENNYIGESEFYYVKENVVSVIIFIIWYYIKNIFNFF